MVPRQLPLEVILQAIDASIVPPINPNSVAPATEAHFRQLRLVNTAVQQRAHQTYPRGISIMASVVAARLLDETPPSSFAATLRDVQGILREAAELRLTYNPMECQAELHDNPAWTFCARLLLRETGNLRRLSVSCRGNGLQLQGLELERVTGLRALEIREGWKHQLHTLDLSGMADLCSFTMFAKDHVDLGDPLNLRLPRLLTTLDLRKIGLTAQDIKSLDIPGYAELQELCVIGENLGDDDVAALGLPRSQKLRRLSLSAKKELSEAALEAVRECQWLEDVDLSGNRLASVAALQLNRNTTLKHLDLSYNDLDDLAELELATNRSLITLNLSFSVFGSPLVGLDINTTLRHLNLSATTNLYLCGLPGQLARNTTLERLDLSHCYLDDTFGRTLQLQKSSGLKELNLSFNNDLGDEGVEALLESIEKHCLRLRVDLEWTGVSEEMLDRFKSAGALKEWCVPFKGAESQEGEAHDGHIQSFWERVPLRAKVDRNGYEASAEYNKEKSKH